MKIFPLLILVLLKSCNTHTTLDSYANSLIINSKAGLHCKKYLQTFEASNELVLFNKVFHDVEENWVYEKDAPGLDVAANAERMFLNRDFRGDCEDQAVLLMAIARQLELDARFCLYKSNTEHSGHIGIEIGVYESAMSLALELNCFKKTPLIKENQLYWISLKDQRLLNHYTKEFYIYPEIH